MCCHVGSWQWNKEASVHESNKRMIKVEIRGKKINDMERQFRLPTLTKLYPTLHIVIREDGDKSLNIAKKLKRHACKRTE